MFKHVLTDTFKPTAAVSAYRFLDAAGNQIAAQGARAYAVSFDSMDADDVANELGLAAVVLGFAELELAGTVTKGARLTASANGRGEAGASGDVVNAIAWEPGDADDIIQVLIIQDGETLA